MYIDLVDSRHQDFFKNLTFWRCFRKIFPGPQNHNCTCVNERVIGSTNSPELVLELAQMSKVLKRSRMTIVSNFELKFRCTVQHEGKFAIRITWTSSPFIYKALWFFTHLGRNKKFLFWAKFEFCLLSMRCSMRGQNMKKYSNMQLEKLMFELNNGSC